MTESLITISIVGLIAGFIFSMPIAGPVSILITSKALNGKLRYCTIFTIGASIADLIYVFGAVYGITKLYNFYKPAIPYILLGGSFIIIYIGYKIIGTKIDLEHIDDKAKIPRKVEKREGGAFYTGFMVNFLNPTLFFGWLTTSFLIITIASSLGFNTGGLESSVSNNVLEIHQNSDSTLVKPKVPSYLKLDTLQFLKRENRVHVEQKKPAHFHLLMSSCFAFSVAIGTIIWFYLMALVISRHRHRINLKILTWIIRSLGIILCITGLYLFYQAVVMLT